ncbi:type II toxin-antitoxin system HicA family toxin [Maricaulis maris]|jgi:predicted RNA binding protein YcfA (HicA-like mRNA interferase family)|uniref:type II toxin-antitoxin system HicA family toxin n=1 Tax=Maricaulis maris TaxID=74318 RepID=UPI0026EBD57C|nr:type II toxin-antitoxin system HicA family toxin [Maricaulis maris]
MGYSIPSRKIIKRLKADGWRLHGIDGDHHNFRKAKVGIVTVPHPSKDIPIGTLRSIFRQANWPWPPGSKDFA